MVYVSVIMKDILYGILKDIVYIVCECYNERYYVWYMLWWKIYSMVYVYVIMKDILYGVCVVNVIIMRDDSN